MKKWYQSKTIWLNAIAFILGLIPLVDMELLTAIGINNPTKYLTILVTVTAVLNKLNRLLTTKSIGSTASK